ncbi:hypothetical protein BJ508DRAFT_306236 [Ascobolus immersus RN42]|uniref:Uncharacterized protein n=1 Tax=Ascobolus immersus RN42 TaxID=1160509 RepID=A0A3N4I8R6_ASCIM|nr:hypothetical protein BJ508DRAFT_306236 [Ascobolus immersus RN42]
MESKSSTSGGLEELDDLLDQFQSEEIGEDDSLSAAAVTPAQDVMHDLEEHMAALLNGSFRLTDLRDHLQEARDGPGPQFAEFSKSMETILEKLNDSCGSLPNDNLQFPLGAQSEESDEWQVFQKLLDDLTTDGLLAEPFAALELELEMELTFDIMKVEKTKLIELHSVYNAVLSVLLGDEKPITTDDDLVSRFQTISNYIARFSGGNDSLGASEGDCDMQ